MEHNYSSRENQGPMQCNWESSHKFQPPGWCIIFEQHKKNKTLPTLPELMIAEMISPGEMVLSLKGSSVKGTLLKNAKILTSEGATFHSPMAWCSAWHDGKTVSRAIAYHRVHYNGVTLIDICQKAFKIAVREITSAATAKKKREQQSEVPKVNIDATAEIKVLHTKSSIDSNCNVNENTEGKSHMDIFMAIQSLLVHSDGAYSEANYDTDIWDNHGVIPIEKFHCIDQW
ncbi:uncharacterized protein [Hetaerina americana]|uniref:uncharacterized protein n=1 Tax=Hetaerina americana TaxID=62018 RepID=UPI003A7F3D25